MIKKPTLGLQQIKEGHLKFAQEVRSNICYYKSSHGVHAKTTEQMQIQAWDGHGWGKDQDNLFSNST